MPDAFVFKEYQFTLDASNIRETQGLLYVVKNHL